MLWWWGFRGLVEGYFCKMTCWNMTWETWWLSFLRTWCFPCLFFVPPPSVRKPQEHLPWCWEGPAGPHQGGTGPAGRLLATGTWPCWAVARHSLLGTLVEPDAQQVSELQVAQIDIISVCVSVCIYTHTLMRHTSVFQIMVHCMCVDPEDHAA